MGMLWGKASTDDEKISIIKLKKVFLRVRREGGKDRRREENGLMRGFVEWVLWI